MIATGTAHAQNIAKASGKPHHHRLRFIRDQRPPIRRAASAKYRTGTIAAGPFVNAARPTAIQKPQTAKRDGASLPETIIVPRIQPPVRKATKTGSGRQW